MEQRFASYLGSGVIVHSSFNTHIEFCVPADGPIHAIMVTLDPLLSVHNIIIHSHDNQSGFVMTRGVTVVTPTPSLAP